MRVLIIEDNREEIELIRLHLEDQSMVSIELDQAITGKEGLELLKQNEYKAIILDYFLPDFDGFELLKLILNYRNLPVIMVTVSGSEEAAVRAIKLGAFDYIPKTGHHYDQLTNVVNKIATFPIFELNKCPISVFAAGSLGPTVVYSDTLPWGSNSDSIQMKAAIFFSTAIGQGDSYHTGMFGPLPVPEVMDHSVMIYSKILEDKNTMDPRSRTATFTLFSIFYPNDSTVFFLDRFRLKDIFDQSLKPLVDILEIPGIIPELKNNLSTRLGEYDPVFNRFY
ncbi:MAG: response regulator [Candidatus Hodarchaeales archaeon]|jgi:CheY-like chemotaxis protein